MRTRWKCVRDRSGRLAVLGLMFACGCARQESAGPAIAALDRSLEEACASEPADVAGDVLAILSSTEPLDPAEPQVYGNAACAGVIFEFDNPDGEPLHGAWIQASGESRTDADVLSEAHCPERALQADYWGYKDKAWTKLASAAESASFVPSAEAAAEGGYCHLDGLIMHEGAFEKLRIVARVTQDAQTYPMHACVW